MRILLVTETLSSGGAETFVVRLANGLSKRHDITVINLHPDLSKRELMDQLRPEVRLVNVSIFAKNWLRRIDALFYRFKIDYSLVEFILRQRIRRLILDNKFDVVHSHLFPTDLYVAKVRSQVDVDFNHTITIHGDYLLFETRPPVRILNYKKKVVFALTAINNAVVISDQQFSWIDRLVLAEGLKVKVRKIFNGYALDRKDKVVSRSDIGLKQSDFVFGMVARGLKEKGWANLIAAFERSDIPNKKLVLIGDGEESKRLKDIYCQNRDILFVGYSSYPISYVRLMDVCVFLSYYEGESLPTTIIEYLLCGKAMICSNVGEVKNMLMSDEDMTAGVLINNKNDRIDEEVLVEKMKLLYDSPSLRRQLEERTKKAAQKFNMETCLDQYMEVYKNKLPEQG